MSRILSTGGEWGVSASVHAGIHPPPPGSRHPPRADPPGADTPPPQEQTAAYGQRAAGTHPTGMHSCFQVKTSQKQQTLFPEKLSLGTHKIVDPRLS